MPANERVHGLVSKSLTLRGWGDWEFKAGAPPQLYPSPPQRSLGSPPVLSLSRACCRQFAFCIHGTISTHKYCQELDSKLCRTCQLAPMLGISNFPLRHLISCSILQQVLLNLKICKGLALPKHATRYANS